VKLIERSVESFLSELGSASPAPGGGSAAALAGAAAAALCAMVCRLTLTRDSCRDAWPDVQKALVGAQELEVLFRGLVDEDAEAYLAVAAARALPRETPEQKESRKAAIQAAAFLAAAAPLRTLETLRACAVITELAAERGNPSCRTDAGSAGALCGAGALAAAWNVRVNLPSIKDAALRGSLSERTREALAEVQAAADRIAKRIDEHLDERSTP
jgi:methenyltetrahydrofolate cyclohydrolase